MSTPAASTLALANGIHIPRFGLGTWPMDDAAAQRVVPIAVEAGYRLVDTAGNYENERGVALGCALRAYRTRTCFVTTKFNKQWHSVDGARRACEASLERLGLDYLDQFLVHWPNPGPLCRRLPRAGGATARRPGACGRHLEFTPT